MKVIKGIAGKLELFSLKDEVELDKSSFKDVFRTIISLSLGKSADQSLEMLELGMKIKHNKEADLELEDAEFKLLKEKVEANLTQQPAFFHAQLLKKLKESENDSSKKS
jgi:hypothetical protein